MVIEVFTLSLIISSNTPVLCSIVDISNEWTSTIKEMGVLYLTVRMYNWLGIHTWITITKSSRGNEWAVWPAGLCQSLRFQFVFQFQLRLLSISICRRFKRVEIVFQTETHKIFAYKIMKTSLQPLSTQKDL